MASKISKLNPADFLKLEPARENKIKEALEAQKAAEAKAE